MCPKFGIHAICGAGKFKSTHCKSSLIQFVWQMLTLNSATAWLDKLDDLGILDELYCSKYFAKVFFGSILSKYFSEILQFARVCVALPRELLGAAAACPVQLRKEATLAGSAPWLEEQTKNSFCRRNGRTVRLPSQHEKDESGCYL